MQRIRAVVKTFKADPVCQALLAAGVDEVYVEEVQGYGRQKGHLGLYRQPAYGISFLPKIAITAYLPEELVEAACAAIEAAAATGTIGDGKIFLTPVEYAIPQSLEAVRRDGAGAGAGAGAGKAVPASGRSRGKGAKSGGVAKVPTAKNKVTKPRAKKAKTTALGKSVRRAKGKKAAASRKRPLR